MDTVSEYWKEGEAYHRAAVGGKKRPEVFTSEIIYNMLAMAIEKYFMAFFEANNTIPDNHTFTDLIDSANRIRQLDAGLEKDLKDLERFQYICPVYDDYNRTALNGEDLSKMYEVTDLVSDYCNVDLSPGC